jgi:predicted nucleic acid-binding protein
VIYLDSSALVKLVLREAESAALRTWLASVEANRTTSELAHVEVLRVCRRISEQSVPPAKLLLTGLDLIPTTPRLLQSAAFMNPTQLRSLDALHLAAAVSLQEALTAFVTYDHRLSAAAGAANLPIFAPD